jgi:hypothetical protein
MKTALKPMGLGDILDGAFAVYRERFSTFLAITAVVYVPYSLAMAVLAKIARGLLPAGPAHYDNGLFNVGAASPLDVAWRPPRGPLFLRMVPNFGDVGMPFLAAVITVVVGLASALLFFCVVYPLCTSALVVNISAGYLGVDLGPAESYARAFKRLGRLLSAQALVTLCVLTGFVLCGLPGFLFLLWFMLVPVVAVLEDHGPFGSLGRSRGLIRGNLGKAFLLAVVVSLLGFGIHLAGGWLVGLVPWPTFVADFLESLVHGLTLPLSIAAIVLFYYDLRVRKEAFDLPHLASRMGGIEVGRAPQAPPPGPDAPPQP